MLIDARTVSILRDDKEERGLANIRQPTGESGAYKPKLYLNVGPPKHGTTSLECTLARIQVSCSSMFFMVLH
jgi:hypothetical protein